MARISNCLAIAIIGAVFAVIFAAPLTAHHSLNAEYDAGKAITIAGVIKKVEWLNPHVWIFMNVKESSGKITPWKIEIGAPAALVKDGLQRDMLDLKSTYSLEVWPSRQEEREAHHGAGRTLTFPDGQRFDIHDTWGMIDLKPVGQK